jgi:hypothetical protein
LKHSNLKLSNHQTQHKYIIKSKHKIYQFNNKTHQTKRQCKCFTLIFWCLGGSSTICGSEEAINESLGQRFATKQMVERLMETRGRWFWCFSRGLDNVLGD